MCGCPQHEHSLQEKDTTLCVTYNIFTSSLISVWRPLKPIDHWRSDHDVFWHVRTHFSTIYRGLNQPLCEHSCVLVGRATKILLCSEVQYAKSLLWFSLYSSCMDRPALVHLYSAQLWWGHIDWNSTVSTDVMFSFALFQSPFVFLNQLQSHWKKTMAWVTSKAPHSFAGCMHLVTYHV